MFWWSFLSLELSKAWSSFGDTKQMVSCVYSSTCTDIITVHLTVYVHVTVHCTCMYMSVCMFVLGSFSLVIGIHNLFTLSLFRVEERKRERNIQCNAHIYIYWEGERSWWWNTYRKWKSKKSIKEKETRQRECAGVLILYIYNAHVYVFLNWERRESNKYQWCL